MVLGLCRTRPLNFSLFLYIVHRELMLVLTILIFLLWSLI